MTVNDFAAYMPAEMLAQVKAMPADQQAAWAKKQTDDMIAAGIIKKSTKFEPWSQSVSKAADDMVPGAGAVVDTAVSDTKRVAADVNQLVDKPTIHQAAKTVADATAIP